MFELAMYSCSLGPWYARVGDENVKTAVQVADTGLNGGGDGFEGDYVYLVRFAYSIPYISAYHFRFGNWVVSEGLHLTP
jgi:hypothetical protein